MLYAVAPAPTPPSQELGGSVVTPRVDGRSAAQSKKVVVRHDVVLMNLELGLLAALLILNRDPVIVSAAAATATAATRAER